MGCVRVKITRPCGATVSTSRIGEGVELKTTRIGDVSVTASLVCTITSPYYLEVEPKTIWVSPDYIRELLVKCDTDWETEY